MKNVAVLTEDGAFASSRVHSRPKKKLMLGGQKGRGGGAGRALDAAGID